MAGKRRSGPDPDQRDEERRIGCYDDWSLDELRRRARDLGLTGYAGKKKAGLIALLRRH